MALGFGFNKAKALASAEKFVQQGKLQNAISEYEKILKQEPGDLNAVNTVGDLYARLGNTDKAVEQFKKVGESYASDGFTLRAIAVYKKIGKVAPQSLENLIRLGELYQQQGLQSEARSQFVLAADVQLKAGKAAEAAQLLRKIVEFDPENTAVLLKLADVLARSGAAADAQAMYLSAAQGLQGRGSFDQALEATKKAIAIDAKSVPALVMAAMLQGELGKIDDAIATLQRIGNIDASPEALRVLCTAYIVQKRWADARETAEKLLSNFQETAPMISFVSAAVASDETKIALEACDSCIEKLYEADAAALNESFDTAVAKVREDADALALLRALFKRMGDASHDAEISELLAHAYAQSGRLAQARDLFHQLAQLEPDNPAHAQSYRQIVAKIGDDVTLAPLDDTVGERAAMIDLVESAAPPIEQEYPEELQLKIQDALTEADLFISYKKPIDAVTSLTNILHEAPLDARVHQKLAPLYARLGDYDKAAKSCELLSQLYASDGHEEFAKQYSDLQANYVAHSQQQARGSETPASGGIDESPMDESAFGAAATVFPPTEAAVVAVQPPASAAAEFDLTPMPAEAPVETVTASDFGPAAASPSAADMASSVPGNDWEEMLSIEHPESASTQSNDTIQSAVEEAQFYLAQSMMNEASAAIDRIQREAPDHPELASLKQKLEAFFSAPAPEIAAAADPMADLVGGIEDAIGELASATPAQAQPQAAAAVASASAAVSPQAPPSAKAVSAVPIGNGSAHMDEGTSMLADLLDEFRDDVEQTAPAQKEEDLDTHYHLGVAFREMGLLDEAIGELQRVCNAVASGQTFGEALQAYTLLAQAFVEKGVPQAATSWYAKALEVNGISSESKWALHYDMASALEAAGDKQSALKHLLEVYSGNIDYRDTAERIKAMRQ